MGGMWHDRMQHGSGGLPVSVAVGQGIVRCAHVRAHCLHGTMHGRMVLRNGWLSCHGLSTAVTSPHLVLGELHAGRHLVPVALGRLAADARLQVNHNQLQAQCMTATGAVSDHGATEWQIGCCRARRRDPGVRVPHGQGAAGLQLPQAPARDQERGAPRVPTHCRAGRGRQTSPPCQTRPGVRQGRRRAAQRAGQGGWQRSVGIVQGTQTALARIALA
jgi:hypothetical protein